MAFSTALDGTVAEKMRLTSAGDLQLTNTLTLVATTSATTGVIYKGADRFIHDYRMAAAEGSNIFVGVGAGNFTMAIDGDSAHSSHNAGVGASTLAALTTGGYNATLGRSAYLSATDSQDSVAIGAFAGAYLTAGAHNNVIIGGHAVAAAGAKTTVQSMTVIGYKAGYTSNSGQHACVFIGNQAAYYETGSHKLYIADSATTTPLIYGDFAAKTITFNATTATVYDPTAATGATTLKIRAGAGQNTTELLGIYASNGTTQLASFGSAGGLGVFGHAAPTSQPADPGSASGTDAAIINAITAILKGAGLCAT